MGLKDNIQEIQSMRKMAESAKKDAETIKASGRSKRGFVAITLDGEKNLKKIEFSEEAMSLSPDELSKYVREAHRVAAKEIDKLMKKQFKNSGLANMFMNK